MATYEELHDLKSHGPLLQKTKFAVTVAAVNFILLSSPTASQLKWASNVLDSPDKEGNKALMILLAANKEVTAEQIKARTKDQVQSQVDDIAANLVAAFGV